MNTGEELKPSTSNPLSSFVVGFKGPKHAPHAFAAGPIQHRREELLADGAVVDALEKAERPGMVVVVFVEMPVNDARDTAHVEPVTFSDPQLHLRVLE